MTERVIFFAALDRDDLTERASYVDRACAGDTDLRRRVEALLRSHATAGEFMDVPAVEQVVGDDRWWLDFLAPTRKPGSLGRLGHYEVLEVVSRGGMGVVVRALDEKLQRVVAIKALAPLLATSSAARRRFAREARAVAAVAHDNIIAIHAVEDTGPLPYLVMQYIDGPTLQEKINRTGSLSLQEILRISLQIAEGLAAAHRQGLIHRDVKPSNILLENSIERVKLTDFGLALVGDDASLTQSGVLAGTPMYMSPEQARGEPVDFRSDLFSLGSVMYTMCTGRPPFRAPTAMAVLKRVCEETPRPIREINPELPPWLDDVLARLHAKEPAERFASAREVADLLARLLAELQQGGMSSLSAVSLPVRPREKRRKVAPPARLPNRWLLAATIPLALLAGFGLGEATDIYNIRATLLRQLVPVGTLVTIRPELALTEPTPPDPNRSDLESLELGAAEVAAWERTVAPLPAEEQVEAVAARLKKLNPGFDGTVVADINGGVVTRLKFSSDHVTNLAPVTALVNLSILDVSGEKGRLSDLSPLRGMSLSVLRCNRTLISDLTPLQGMPLKQLDCAATAVSDLTPLKGMPLRALFCAACLQVADLSPLQGMRLSNLDVGGTSVSDLSPLRDMPLTSLDLFNANRVTDLSPTIGMPLEYINIGHLSVSDLSALKDITKLHTLIANDTSISDLSALRGRSLKRLSIRRTKVQDLSPLQGMPLQQLTFDYQPERDGELLRSLTNLEQINDMPAAEFWKQQVAE